MKAHPLLGLFATALLVAGCESERPPRHEGVSKDATKDITKEGAPLPKPVHVDPPPDDEAGPTAPETGWKKTLVGKHVWLETKGDRRRVRFVAEVCLREGQYGLECLVCRKHTKEHESILSSEAEGKVLHATLMAARAKPGTPVKFDPKFEPPTGSRVKISLEYMQGEKPVAESANRWIMANSSKKDLEHDWVFAGSLLLGNPIDPQAPPIYAADGEGALVCVTNVPTALLDLPVDSPKGLEDRAYVPHTKRIPPLKTVVEVLLEPVPDKR